MPGCPECGAPAADGLSCWEQLGMVLAWEGEDPELQALHFFIVAGYNLQHPAQFTDDTLAGLRELFREAVDEDLLGPEIRRRAVERTFGATRVRRPEGDRHPVLRPWALTLADVYPPGPEGAAERVRAWSRAIRLTLDP